MLVRLGHVPPTDDLGNRSNLTQLTLLNGARHDNLIAFGVRRFHHGFGSLAGGRLLMRLIVSPNPNRLIFGQPEIDRNHRTLPAALEFACPLM